MSCEQNHHQFIDKLTIIQNENDKSRNIND